MNKIRIILFLIILLYPVISYCQNRKWKSFRWEAIYGGGASAYYGDLGGGSSKVHNFITDLNFKSIRGMGTIAARWKFKEKIAVRFNLYYAELYGNDALSKNPTRMIRNLNFRTTIYEQSVQIEYSILKEKFGLAYSFSNMKRFSFININTYVFIGLGGFFFNPEIKVAGNWIKPEGQSVYSNGKSYAFYQLAFPLGVGFKYGLNRRMNIGLELSNRWTTTDYLDNHSDKYSKRKDSYAFALLYFAYKLKTTRSGLPNMDFLKKIKL
jgi:hypothetical protein